MKRFTVWDTRLNIVKIIYRFSAITIKTPERIFVYTCIDKLILKFLWKGTSCRIARIILKRKHKVRGITQPDINDYCTCQIIRTAWWQQR